VNQTNARINELALAAGRLPRLDFMTAILSKLETIALATVGGQSSVRRLGGSVGDTGHRKRFIHLGRVC
jgi:hypothetical protein